MYGMVIIKTYSISPLYQVLAGRNRWKKRFKKVGGVKEERKKVKGTTKMKAKIGWRREKKGKGRRK